MKKRIIRFYWAVYNLLFAPSKEKDTMNLNNVIGLFLKFRHTNNTAFIEEITDKDVVFLMHGLSLKLNGLCEINHHFSHKKENDHFSIKNLRVNHFNTICSVTYTYRLVKADKNQCLSFTGNEILFFKKNDGNWKLVFGAIKNGWCKIRL